MSENWAKTVQTSLLFLNQIANFVTVNSEKTLNSCQITKMYFKLGKVAGKLRTDAKTWKKMRKVAKDAESCGIVKLAKVAISATSATARNSRGCDLWQILYSLFISRCRFKLILQQCILCKILLNNTRVTPWLPYTLLCTSPQRWRHWRYFVSWRFRATPGTDLRLRYHSDTTQQWKVSCGGHTSP